jgi:hypothetical protein
MNIYSKNNLPKEFYVYAYIRKNGTPYYIGKGFKRRAWNRHRQKLGDNTYSGVHTPPNSRIIIMEANLTEVGAFALERRYIRWYGRKDLETGILLNRTDGGEGGTGKRGYAYNPSRGKNISKSLKKGYKSGKIIPWNRGLRGLSEPWNKNKTKDSDERVASYAKTLTGRSRPDMIGNIPWNKGKSKHDDTRIEKVSENNKGRIPWNKGIESVNKGLTYEEIYGNEKAAVLKEKKKQAKQEYWNKMKSEVIVCPHCNKAGSLTLKRWHFDNCREKK